VAMYKDKSHDAVWRNYTIQFLAPYYEKRWPAGSAVNMADPERQAILDTLWEALLEKDGPIAGTALIGVELLSRTHSEIDKGRMRKAACDLALDDACGVESRIAAIQICGMIDSREALPTVRTLAQAGEVTPLRIASIAALGRLGSSDDEDLLQSLAAGSEQYPRKAAEAALKRLRKRLKAESALK